MVGWLGGLIPGGVVVLLHASQELEKLHDAATCPERKFTIQLFQNALKMPVKAIASSAGFDRFAVVEKLLKQDNPDIGFDPARGEICTYDQNWNC